LSNLFQNSERNRPKLIEIKTPREENAAVLDTYFSYLKS
jgi:hypothetical protein